MQLPYIYMGKLQAHINRLDAQEAGKNKPKPMTEPTPVRAKVPRNTYVLGFFNYPGCIVVCNTAREEKGDFVKLAHVSHKGEIMRYFKTNLPADIVERIDQCAFETKEKHEQKLQDEKKVRQLHKEWLLTQGYTREQIIKTYGPFWHNTRPPQPFTDSTLSKKYFYPSRRQSPLICLPTKKGCKEAI